MFNEATFREILLPSPDDRRSISQNVASLNILVHDKILFKLSKITEINKAIITLSKITSILNKNVSLDMNKVQKLICNFVFSYPHV